MEMEKGMSEKPETGLASTSQPNELKNIIEAAIMVSGEPITVDRLLGMFTDTTKPERSAVKDLLFELEQEYANRGFELKRIDKGYRLQTREEYSPWLARLTAGRPPRYSRAMLETLAIIAYRQPVTRGEIEEIRGVAVSTDIIRTLVERDWIRQVGVRDVPGKPALFATTRTFLEYFNLEGLSQLPSLQDIRDLDTIADELNMKLPLESRNEESADADDSEKDEDHKANEKGAENSPQSDFIENAEKADEAPVNDEKFTVEDMPVVETDSAAEHSTTDSEESDQADAEIPETR
ncbi:MAG: SMC-Scp complex subunit ScpB [Gammaproteobacteria bacterium]|nr:SMC-Scp complex subunit ScpB [Gammaproteobacteria bacterium]MDX2487262.1 SMC-Scp complex subunit ScpB [Gammaproteobacteria bacterium]